LTDLATAGVPFDRLRSWGELVERGALARVLTQLCVLAADRFELGYRLARDGLTVSISGETHAIELPADDVDTLGGMARVLHAINELVPGDEQLVLIDAARAWRIVLADPRALPDDVGSFAQRCVRPARGEPALREPAALPALDTPCFDEDGSLLGLVAAYVERLARFGGHEHLHAEPRWTQDPGAIALVLAWRPPDRGGLQITVQVPIVADRIDPQPILDALNRFADDDVERRLYRVARGADRVDVALLDRATAGELRRRGELVEHDGREALSALAECGFELPWSRDGKLSLFEARDLATQLALLAAGTLELSGMVAGTGSETTVTWTVAGVRHAQRYAGRDLACAQLLADLNGVLARAGAAYRCVAISGEPFFYNKRLVLLDRAWLAILPRARIVPGCITDAELDVLDVALGTHPPPALPEPAPPRLPRIDELVQRENIRDDDFKCSARPSDLGELIRELGEFARVAVEVGACTGAGDRWVFEVTYRGQRATIELADEKYADVSPILDYLNRMTAERTPRRRLYYFRAGTWGGGVVRATDDEAAKLRLAGYIA
jgi:hypothetical protein